MSHPESTTTTQPSTSNTDNQASVRVIEQYADRLERAAGDLSASSGTVSAGVVRRHGRLLRQVHSSRRLVERGRSPLPVALTARIEVLQRLTPVEPADLRVIESRIDSMRSLIRALHEWRGHFKCLPTPTPPTNPDPTTSGATGDPINDPSAVNAAGWEFVDRFPAPAALQGPEGLTL